MNKYVVRTVVAFVCIFSWLAEGQTKVDVQVTTAKLSGPFFLTNNCVSQANDTDLPNGGRAAFKFKVPSAGDYAIKAQVQSPPGQSGAFYLNVDGEPQGAEMLWQFPKTIGPMDFVVTSNSVAPGSVARQRVFKLSAGEHDLIVVGRTGDARLSDISILQLPTPPGGLRIVGDVAPSSAQERPAAPTGLRIVSEQR